MRWHAISGSWRRTNERLESDVEEVVKEILSLGDGIITGGALRVDYTATQTVLRNKDDPEERLRIYLPVSLEKYLSHLYHRASEKVISIEDADKVTFQLIHIQKKYPRSIFDEVEFTEVNPVSYYARNGRIVYDCDELHAFHVNKTKGVQDAIDKARSLGKPIHIKEYSIK